MNNQQRAAMQMALDYIAWNRNGCDKGNVLTALREALAQADKPHIVRDGGNWGMSPRYKCSACDEEFRSEHRAHWHCQNECKALAQPPEPDLDVCPGCGGIADNGHDREYPPNPYYCTKCTEQPQGA